jgi:hypothetical protein
MTPRDPRRRAKKPAPVPSLRENGRRAGLPKDMRAWVFKRDRNRCKKCGARSGLECHHIVEVYKGGQHDVDNLDTLCEACHAEWTWNEPEGVTYAEWILVPPGRWFVAMLCRMRRNTPEGISFLMNAAKITAVEFFGHVDKMRKERLG